MTVLHICTVHVPTVIIMSFLPRAAALVALAFSVGACAAAPDMTTTNRTMHLAYASFCDEGALASWT
jgi:hypothetical protein